MSLDIYARRPQNGIMDEIDRTGGGQNEDEEVFSLIYLSEATESLDENALEVLAVEAAANNACMGITGYLTFRGSRFTQYLEGPQSEVLALMERIKNDERHTVLVVVELGTLPRYFPGWSMRHLDPLWHPIEGPLDTIEELLSLVRQSPDDGSADQAVITSSLTKIVGQVAQLTS